MQAGRPIEGPTNRSTDRIQTCSKAGRPTTTTDKLTHTDKSKDRPTGRPMDGPTDRYVARQTNRQTYRSTDRQTGGLFVVLADLDPV